MFPNFLNAEFSQPKKYIYIYSLNPLGRENLEPLLSVLAKTSLSFFVKGQQPVHCGIVH